MKKKISICLTFAVITLTACKNGSSEPPATTTIETTAPATEASTVAEIPSTTETADTESTLSDKYDWSGAEKVVMDALSQIGITKSDIKSMVIGNVSEYIDGVNAEYSIQTNDMTLTAPFFYTKTLDIWNVLYIDNADNQHVYYIDETLTGTMDLYSYPSDELVSPATKTLDEYSEELETIWESLDAKNDAAFSSIADEFNINKQ